MILLSPQQSTKWGCLDLCTGSANGQSPLVTRPFYLGLGLMILSSLISRAWSPTTTRRPTPGLGPPAPSATFVVWINLRPTLGAPFCGCYMTSLRRHFVCVAALRHLPVRCMLGVRPGHARVAFLFAVSASTESGRMMKKVATSFMSPLTFLSHQGRGGGHLHGVRPSVRHRLHCPEGGAEPRVLPLHCQE